MIHRKVFLEFGDIESNCLKITHNRVMDNVVYGKYIGLCVFIKPNSA